MDWLAKSPHLNPTEEVWNILGRCIRQMEHLPKTIQELEQALIRELQEIPQATVRRLIKSITSRYREFIHAMVTIHTIEKTV